jgi:hypothetical protein
VGSSDSLLSFWCQVLHGHRRWDVCSPRPQRLSTRRQAHQHYLTPTTILRGYYSLNRVLTFDYAGFRQRSLSRRRFGLRLRGRSGLLSGRRGFFFCHCCRGFIPLPGQIRRLPAEYTSRLLVKHDYDIKYYSGRFNTYKLGRTTVTVGAPRMLAMSTSPASAGASSCASAAAAPSTVTAAGVVLSCASAATTSSAAAAAGSVLP